MSETAESSGTETFGHSLTDLMTSLAIIFVLLLVVFLKHAHDQSERAKESVQKQLADLLEAKKLEIRQDAKDPLTLAVKLDETLLRFPVGGDSLTSSGDQFVRGFFKTFAQQICEPSLRAKIDSVIIEGHTDNSGERTPEGVRHNIALSQRRSYAVLESALKSLPSDSPDYECLLKLASANGRGSREPIYEPVAASPGKEAQTAYSPHLSRRVEVKIRVKSAEQALLQASKGQAPPPAASR